MHGGDDNNTWILPVISTIDPLKLQPMFAAMRKNPEEEDNYQA